LTSALGIRARAILSLTMIGLVASPLAAQEPQKAAPGGQPQQHVVKKGDTLWDLAGFYFTNPFLWPVIFEANRSVVEDPHWIYPGEILGIPGVESGLPVTVQQQDTMAPPPIVQPATGPRQQPSPRTRFYTPPVPEDPGRRIMLAERDEPLYVVPPASYLSAAWLADTASLDIRGRFVTVGDPTRQHDRLAAVLRPFEEILAAGEGAGATAGDTLMMVRFGEHVLPLGRVIEPVAIVSVDSVGETMIVGHLVKQFAEGKAGDYLIPMEPVPTIQRGLPSPVQDGAKGRLVRFFRWDEPLHGTSDNGFVDLGADAVGIGDELVAYVPARPGPGDTELPDEVVAWLRVVKVRANSATVRVMDVRNAGLRAGLLVRVVRRMAP
jgi:hypothetical protein